MNEVRRAALADYLRARRAGLRPEDVGLAPGRRRRTPGLRREEVALLSNVGVTWYTWLEQGRDITPSPEILAALARTLRLDEAGTEYLYRLAGWAPPAPGPSEAPDHLLRMMHAQSPAPAILMDGGWDLVAWNEAAEGLYRYTEYEPADRNAAWIFFTSPHVRAETTDWEPHARRILAELRDGFARTGDERVERLLRRLRAHVPEVAVYLDAHEVTHRGAGITGIVKHAVAGELHLDQVVLSAEAPGLQLVVKLPRPGTGTEERLPLLVQPRQTPNHCSAP